MGFSLSFVPQKGLLRQRIPVFCSPHMSALQWKISLSHTYLGLMYFLLSVVKPLCHSESPHSPYTVLPIPWTSAESPFSVSKPFRRIP